MRKLLCTIMAVGLLATGAWAQTTIYVSPGDDIHLAVAGANAGDTVFFNTGTYALGSTINVTEAITLEGASEGGVIFDVNCGSGYGIHPSVGGVTLKNFTLNMVTPSGEYAGYAIHASGTPNVQVGLTIEHVTIQGASGADKRRAGVDIHGYDDVVLSYVTSKDATWGNGIQITGCVNVDVDNCTTMNNAWGSLSIYCSQYLVPNRASDDVDIDAGTCSFGENNVFIENQFGLTSTNVVVDGYDYYLTNDEFRAGAEGFIFIKDTLADVQAHALHVGWGFVGYEHATVLQEIATGEYVVDATLGIGMTIQGAIDAASPGDVVNVGAGTFREQLIIDKSLTLAGAGEGVTTVEAPDPIDRAPYSITVWTGSSKNVDPVIGANAAGTVHVRDLTVDGRDTGPNDFYGIHYFDTSGSITDCTVAGIHYPAGPGAQNVLSIVATQSASPGALTIDISGNTVPSFQKGGIAVKGPDQTFTVNNNEIDANPSPDIAGNGIQLSYGATGSTLNNIVSGVGYTGDDWAGTGILLFECGDVTMTGDTVTGSQSGVNYSDWRWVYAHPSPVNLEMNNLTLTGNEWSLGFQLSGDQSDLVLDVNGGAISNSGGDAVDVWGTGIDPWGGSYYTGWNNGDLTVDIEGLSIDGTAIDAIWTGDFSGNATNVVHGFDVTECSITGSTGYAMANNFPETINAPRNYWDDPAGPTVGAKSLGERRASPPAMPAGFDLPEKGSARVVETAADKAGGAVTGPIVVSPWYGLLPGASPMTWGTSTSISATVALANPYDTINVAAGSYNEMVTINKPLTLNGANAGVHPAVGTHPTEVVGTRGPETDLTHNGLFAFRPEADDITIDGFLFSGDGGRIIDTYADANNFHLTNCIFDNDGVATSTGVIQFGGGSHTDMTIDFNLFQDKGDHTIYTGAAADVYDRLLIAWNKFNVEGNSLFWTADTLVDGVIQGNEFDGTIGGTPGVGFCTVNAGKMGNLQIKDNWVHDTAFIPFQVGIIGGSVTGNTFERIHPYTGYYGVALQLWGGEYGTLVSNDVVVEDNVFHFNDVPGVTDPVYAMDLRPGAAPDPGIDGTTIVCRNNQFLDGGVLSSATAIRHRSDTTNWVDAIDNWWGSVSGPFHATLNPAGTGAKVGDFVTFDPWTGMGTLSIVPATSGPLSCGDTQVLTVHYEPGNPMTPLRGYTMTLELSTELAFTDSVITFTNALDDLSQSGHVPQVILTNGDGTITVDNTILGTTDGLEVGADLFSFSVTTASEGTGTADLINTTLRDVTNQINIGSIEVGAEITVDCTAPPAASIAALPGPDTVRLTWTIDNTDVDHFELYRAVWHLAGDELASAYPEYDDVNVPVDRQTSYLGVTSSTEWTPVDLNLASGTVSYDADTGLDRGIYWYELFAVDAAGNVSAMTAEYVRATNYFLGDFDEDGLVYDYVDVNALGTYYGTTQDTGDPGADIDIGPTDDFTGLGIPETDNTIGFEDLMIFALNYDTVSKQERPATPATIALNWVRLDQDTWALELNEPCEGLLGLNVRAPLPEGVSVTVERGELLDQQSTPAFLATAPDGLDIGVAALGQGFTGQGELLRVTAAGVEELSPAIDARGHDNAAIDVALTMSAADLPTALALSQNHPNPFNPSTTIKFDLPARGRVDLKVYALDGSLVRTLVSEVMDQGHHDVVWYGRDDSGRQAATGTYFYRMVADGKTLVRKMTLMK